MNLNLIEILTILQHITIRNRFDGNNIKPRHKQQQASYNKSLFWGF